MNNLDNISKNFGVAWKSLNNSWVTTKESWKDLDRDMFEKEIVGELTQGTNAYMAALKSITDTINQISKQIP